MTIYEYLKKPELKEIIFNLTQAGILSYQIIRDVELMNNYHNLPSSYSKELKYTLLGEEYELSNKRVQQIVLTLNEDLR